MPLLPHDDVPGLEPLPGRYLRAARLTVWEGAVRLHAIAWEGEAERVLTFDLDAEGTPRFVQAGTGAPAVPACTNRGVPSASRSNVRTRSSSPSHAIAWCRTAPSHPLRLPLIHICPCLPPPLFLSRSSPYPSTNNIS